MPGPQLTSGAAHERIGSRPRCSAMNSQARGWRVPSSREAAGSSVVHVDEYRAINAVLESAQGEVERLRLDGTWYDRAQGERGRERERDAALRELGL